MILKIAMFLLTISIALRCISGASFSQVFVRSGSNLMPLEYVQYGVPSVSLVDSQIAKISNSPIEQVVSVPSAPGIIVPCATPCVYSGQIVSAPLSPTSPNLITYKSNVPVVTPSKEEETGYEYSYMVYDKNTGDNKSQFELSDGSIVRGEYSFLQPDGYIREVSYVADDTKGFNAIVNYLPETKEKKEELNIKLSQSTPSPNVKKLSPKISENYKEKLVDDINVKQSTVKQDLIKEPNKKEEIVQKYIESIPNKEKKLNESPVEIKKNLEIEALTAGPSTYDKVEQTSPPIQFTEPTTALYPSIRKEKASINNDNKDVLQDTNTQVAIVKTETTTQQSLQPNDILVSYNDILKCVQTTLNGVGKVNPVSKSESPLTYIILNKPC